MSLFRRRIKFDLVAVDGQITVSANDWIKIQFHLLEFQPASRVRLLGAPPDRIRVWAHGAVPEIAPGLLQRVEELAGTQLTLHPCR